MDDLGIPPFVATPMVLPDEVWCRTQGSSAWLEPRKKTNKLKSDTRSSNCSEKPTFTHENSGFLNIYPKPSKPPKHSIAYKPWWWLPRLGIPDLRNHDFTVTVLQQLGITLLKFAGIQGQHRRAEGHLQGAGALRALRALQFGPEILLHLFTLDGTRRLTRSLVLGGSKISIIIQNPDFEGDVNGKFICRSKNFHESFHCHVWLQDGGLQYIHKKQYTNGKEMGEVVKKSCQFHTAHSSPDGTNSSTLLNIHDS